MSGQLFILPENGALESLFYIGPPTSKGLPTEFSTPRFSTSFYKQSDNRYDLYFDNIVSHIDIADNFVFGCSQEFITVMYGIIYKGLFSADSTSGGLIGHGLA